MNHDNTNRISLWKNDSKENEKHADYTGTINVDGVEYFVDCWRKGPTASKNAPVLSGKVKRKDKQAARAAERNEDI
jgi:hypothetical protein